MASTTDTELERVLTLIRNKIREQGFTQLEVQEQLGWGRSYISQLLTRQKALRVEQVLMILETIDVEPREFYAELYHLPPIDARESGFIEDSYTRVRARIRHGERLSEATPASEFEGWEQFLSNFRQLRAMLRGLVQLLTDKEIVEPQEVAEATKSADPDMDKLI